MAQQSGASDRNLPVISLGARLATAAVSYVRYILDVFWPANLAMLYPYSGTPLWGAAAAMVALLAFTVVVILLARRAPHLPVGWLWFLGTLVPVIGIVTVGYAVRADRYTYFPLIGLFIIIAWSIPSPTSAWNRRATAALASAVLIALGVQTHRQLQHWRNSPALFEHTLAVIGPNLDIVLNYGVAMVDYGEYDSAIAIYRRARGLWPDSPAPVVNMGVAYVHQRRLDDAMQCFRDAIALDPAFAPAHLHAGLVLAAQGRFAEAEQYVREALRLRPDESTRQVLSELLKVQGKSH